VFNANYIGDNIPMVPTVYQGIRTNVMWGTTIYGLMTPRKKTDIMPMTAPKVIGVPDPATISGVLAGQCGRVEIKIFNEGVGNVTITALYLDDLPATDEFHLVTPPTVPFVLGTWQSKSVWVDFCPLDAGPETTNLIVEYGVGKTLVIPINGETVTIFPIPYFTDFTTADDRTGWSSQNMLFGNIGYNLIVANPGYYYGWSWVTPNSASPAIVYSPGFDLRTAEKPTLTFWMGTYYSNNMLVQYSTDKQNWNTLLSWQNFTFGNGVGKYNTVSLDPAKGHIIFLRWYSNFGNYWGLDNVTVQEEITTPIFKATPDKVDFGGVQVGSTATASVTISNIGVSVLKIKKVELVAGSQFGLTDTNTYPVEITDGSYAYAVNGTTSLTFDVSLTPDDVGAFNGKVVVTYGLYSDMTVEIPLMGEGLSCYTATEAHIGENLAPSGNTWYKYTAEKFQITEITSCDPRNTIEPYDYSYDTYIQIYRDCEGTNWSGSAEAILDTDYNDDMEGNCPTNRANSRLQVVMNEGETVYIFWDGRFMNDCATCALPFYFHINPSYPIDGDVCETAIPLTLPVVNHFGTTRGFNDDYDASPCSPFSNYMDGNDKVYSITLPYEGYLTGSILGSYGSIHVLDKCPKVELEKNNCKAYIGGPNGGEFTKRIPEGFYYVIISTWAPPQTVDFLLNMSFRGVGVDDNSLQSSLSVFPNPTSGRFTVSISNAEATDMTLELVNISGQVVYRTEVKAAYSYTDEIDAGHFAKGVYYLKVNDGTTVKVEKIVVN
jgi:hypothetical protein